ncbi:MAG: 5-deoxy-glucuronate isomerase [Sphaerochaetaceae bacterium]|nr:5-deoxy-glucuronate isomerase [Sphaerochaetaceae bacterium]
MVIKKKVAFKSGYNEIVSKDGQYKEMRLDFGILSLKRGESYSCELPLERAFLLISGHVTFKWENQSFNALRYCPLDDNPICLQVSKKVKVEITAELDSEICIERCENNKVFKSILYKPGDTKTEVFGEGVLNDTSKRSVRTIFDGQSAPWSNMVMGEVINHPGRWSSYPPHDHPQPEIYHYRMYPKQGFGVSIIENEATVVEDGDTSLIFPNLTHSQVAAPGYAMYYIWMIAHLKTERWLPTTRYFREEHKWLNGPNPVIWPDRKF